jgi:hypothetical protein
MTATADQQAAQNRLTIRVNVLPIRKETDDFEKPPFTIILQNNN